ncbi:39S ribosomal protein L12, mitochondrial [Osmia bicornis bicornis]|uniref:39S ribosomal protein L12, mitochondrial n=1 Tax=Osmia bicornis bicornis TaxID=1437191 RepID=UPI001EAE95B3|nr:39S ribosomal protein L12, mitochondrial [Osmia bicornis bicornis]
MMNAVRFVCQRNVRQIRQFHKCIVQHTEVEATTVSTPAESSYVSTDTDKKPEVSSKIEQIASQIVALNLIEVAQLSDLLKKRLNLPDAPMMSMGAFVGAPKAEEEEEEPQQVQTIFTVKLKAFKDDQKVALIKEMKTILPDCNLVQAKKFVESAPVVVRADIPKDEAEQLKEAIEKVGGEVEIV